MSTTALLCTLSPPLSWAPWPPAGWENLAPLTPWVISYNYRKSLKRCTRCILPSERKRTAVIYHQIRLAMRPDAPRHKVDEALGLLRRMGQEIDAVEHWAVGRDIGGDFDYGALFVVKDIDAYRAYMHAPLHRQVDEIGLPLVRNMISQDLTDDEDPEIADKIRKIHADRFAGDPALAALIEGLGSYEGSGVANG